MPFRLYNDLMGTAKESVHAAGSAGGEASKGPELLDLGEQTDPKVRHLVARLGELIKELPAANSATLNYIVSHLHR